MFSQTIVASTLQAATMCCFVASAVVGDIMTSPITPIFGIQVTEFRSCVKVKVAVLGSPS